MINDPELKAMSDVYDALQSLDGSTQQRVVEWVLAKLHSSTLGSPPKVKRGPKPGTKRLKRGRKPRSTSTVKVTGAKRGPKPGSKRGPKPGTGGRPKASGKKSQGGRRGRPRKNPVLSQE